MKRAAAQLAVVLVMVLVSAGWGRLTPVFHYSFPMSYDGTSNAIIDLSGSQNDGTMDSMGGYLNGDVPPGFVGGSLTGSSGGHGQTLAVSLLSNSAIEAAGGFTMDVWFMWEGTYTNTRKLIDYAGTENLQTNANRIAFVFNGNVSSDSLTYPIEGQKWYHCIAEFDTRGRTVGEGGITGIARLWVDDLSGAGLQLVASREITKSSFGDGLMRPIGINRWAGGGDDWNQGKIFNPAVYLGVSDSAATTPQPADHQPMFNGNTLSWQLRDLYEVSGFDIYIDPNETKVAAGDPAVRAAQNWADSEYSVATALLPDTVYYWRVDCREPNSLGGDIVHPGEVWSFRTAPLTPYVTRNPVNQTVPAGGSATFTAAGENQTDYAWYRSADAANDTPADDTPVGGNDATLVIEGVSAEDEGYYYCVLSNEAGSDVTRTAVLAIQKLVATWQFEGDLADAIGDFDGMKFGDPNATFVDGSIAGGMALDLGGDAAVEVPYTDKLNTDSFTVCAWAKPVETGEHQAVISSRDDAPSKGYILYVTPSNQWSFWTGNGSFGQLGGTAVAFGAWSHLAITFEVMEIDENGAVTGTKTLYVNGRRVSSTQATMLPNPRRNLLIGAGENETPTHNFFFVGQIDDVRYYNYALDGFEIADMYTEIVSDVPVCVVNPAFDIAGPDGTPDCKVDLYDLAALAGQWMQCNIRPASFCF
ncbi:MAG TPA: immunoglobulin domain-containing protein [Anaerohalosphaeraceae bacterium]|jgi:hypothetical protein|nr:immunoglobulin domain-containing protein [Anaerohalosphaeraceae bacterium]HRT49549.1 immunoglobulin domain-containing protein [Anaerohalosphaeraceae bacterium]HRT85516.1 immunoglobulin domain-containing protein [Anaerohalosphaeraceae bacterium]